VRRTYASRTLANADAYNRRWQGHGVHASYDEALEDATVDAVVIATPPATHLSLTLRALRAGKHVIVEKPAYPRSADFAVVRRAAAESARTVMVAENYFYKPLLTTLRRLVEANAVGEPRFLQINALRSQQLPGWRDDPRLAGGGALLEGAIHWVNFLANLGYSIESARGFQPARNGRLDRSMLVVIEYGEGPIATLHYSWEIPALLRGLHLSRLAGTKGTVTFETNGLFTVLTGRRTRIEFPSLRDIAGYRHMWRDFLRALREETEPAMTLAHAERDLKLVESIYATLD
jgi:predicted dehydrogenase